LQVTNAAVDKKPGEQTAHQVRAHNLESIHERYGTVLANLQEGHSCKANAFLLVRCPPSTIRHFVMITKLKIVDARENELVACYHTNSDKLNSYIKAILKFSKG